MDCVRDKTLSNTCSLSPWEEEIEDTERGMINLFEVGEM